MRIEAFCDDKYVARVLHALDGLVIQLAVVPVRNATAKGGKVTDAGHPTTGREVLIEVAKRCLAAKKPTFTSQEAFAVGDSFGIGRNRIMSAITLMKEKKELKAKGRGLYQIVTKEKK